MRLRPGTCRPVAPAGEFALVAVVARDGNVGCAVMEAGQSG
ncbi:hypothetical protein [Streptomyces sp. HGB0020]|nr:hypothetical protein [Streptomyces sp. HGB0020]